MSKVVKKKRVDAKKFFSILLISLLILLLIVIVSTLNPLLGNLIKLWFLGVGIAYFSNAIIKEDK